MSQGFVYAGPPKIDGNLVGLILPQSPVIVVILVIEHIAIAKNFGKQFGYHVVPSQEIMAQGTANMLGPFLGGYSCTGSFGASAVLSKAAVRTPLAGMFSGMILLLALYALTAVFYFIPRAALAGLIIHAVLNLVAGPATVKRYWRLSPFECLIWIIGVILAIFKGLETSIYVTIGLSLLLLLIRLARTNGQVLGRVAVTTGSIDVDAQREKENSSSTPIYSSSRDVYLPINKKDASNPRIPVESPHPGVCIYHFPEGFNYLNQALQLRTLSDYVYSHTKRTTPQLNLAKHDALWCDSTETLNETDELPTLKAIVIDCSTINSIDITSVQGLVDLRNALDRWASPTSVNWHFGGLRNRWARRALATAGFGRISENDRHSLGNWTPMYSLTTSFGGATQSDVSSEILRRGNRLSAEEESCDSSDDVIRVASKRDAVESQSTAGMTKFPVDPKSQVRGEEYQSVFAIDRPLFHADLTEAVAAALEIVRSHDG